MPNIFRLDEFMASPKVAEGEDGLVQVELDGTMESGRCLWAFVFAMALKDRAWSVRYHPWLGEARLSYMVFGQWYSLRPPSADMNRAIISAARGIIGGGIVTRLLGTSLAGPFEVEWQGSRTEWVGSVWAAGGKEGAEFYCLSVPAAAQRAEDTVVPTTHLDPGQQPPP